MIVTIRLFRLDHLKLIIIIKMDDFLNIIGEDPKVRVKINDMLDRYTRLPYNYQSKRRYHTLIQNVILEELIKIMGGTIGNLDIELKMKISRRKC